MIESMKSPIELWVWSIRLLSAIEQLQPSDKSVLEFHIIVIIVFCCEICFLKESKYFSLYTILSYTMNHLVQIMNMNNHGKDWKNVSLKLRGLNPSFRHGTIFRLVIWIFEYARTVCKVYILLESKWRNYTMAFVLNYLKF